LTIKHYQELSRKTSISANTNFPQEKKRNTVIDKVSTGCGKQYYRTVTSFIARREFSRILKLPTMVDYPKAGFLLRLL